MLITIDPNGFIFFLAVTVLVAGLAVPALPLARTESEIASISKALHARLESQVSSTNKPDLDRKQLREFYTPSRYRPVWVDSRGPLLRAGQWLLTLQAAKQEGLNPETYHSTEIEQLWGASTSAELARLELLLSDAFFKYSVDVSVGRTDPEMIDPNWNIPVQTSDAVNVLRNTLAADNFDSALSELAPPHVGYQRLRNALADYRQLERNGGWPAIPPGPSLKYGQWHSQIKVLRRRLIAEGDLQLGPVLNENIFDTPVLYAVERFQTRYGLKVDGIVGPATRATMNVPVARRIEQIKLNMERWRWLPRDLGQRYLMVNIPGFELVAMEDGRPKFTMRVIIGTSERPTPVIMSSVHTIIFNPFWTVPDTIVINDFLPKQQRNPTYLKSRGIRVLARHPYGKELDPAKIDWTQVSADNFPYILRQDPGPTNPLGQVKFLFSNQFQVYLHDTPEYHKFDLPDRELSSGCIRVDDPVQLVIYLLDRDNDWTREHIETVIAAGETRKVQVHGLVKIYLLYWTAWVGEAGAMHFYRDIYAEDSLISSCSYGARWP
ncbi:MAG: L,D-transpeptidase family protein [Proteobacteria bacterium]|jgi:L,D-transpeptidase YcbB|nr:L,D-transpeptidase family protein [Pseudomonadota bacterium]